MLDFYDALERVMDTENSPLNKGEYDFDKLKGLGEKLGTSFIKMFLLYETELLTCSYVGLATCRCCGGKKEFYFDEQEFNDFLSNGVECLDCEDIRLTKEGKMSRKRYELTESADWFIDRLLGRKNIKQTSEDDFEQIAEHYADSDKLMIAKYVKKMEYRDFLQTRYWKAIAKEVKRRADWRCSLCNDGTKLAAHHRTYGILGKELDHMNSLTCLCERCHSKHHNKN